MDRVREIAHLGQTPAPLPKKIVPKQCNGGGGGGVRTNLYHCDIDLSSSDSHLAMQELACRYKEVELTHREKKGFLPRCEPVLLYPPWRVFERHGLVNIIGRKTRYRCMHHTYLVHTEYPVQLYQCTVKNNMFLVQVPRIQSPV